VTLKRKRFTKNWKEVINSGIAEKTKLETQYGRVMRTLSVLERDGDHTGVCLPEMW
jgi:hypothetical protein